MAKKSRKLGYTTSLIIQGTQIKARMRLQLLPVVIKKIEASKC
jgi:hypothetical protein